MNIISFLNLLRIIFGKKLPDLEKIQRKGLLAVKIAQHFALRIDFLDEKVCTHLANLFRNNVSLPPEKVDLLLNQYTTPEWMNNFSQFEKYPFASASVGQVHNAKLTSNEEVVVKIMKKNYREDFLKDIHKLEKFIKFIVFLYPKLKKVFDPLGIIRYIREYTLDELDLRNEIVGEKILREIFQENQTKYDFGNYCFTKIYPEYSNERLLVSKKIDGSTFDELLDKQKLEYSALLNLFRIHGFYLFAIGIFHGDIHPGNIFLTSDGKICFIDTGAISRVGEKIRTGLFYFFDALCDYDYERCCICLQNMSLKEISESKMIKFKKEFFNLYSGFKGSVVSKLSLTKKMMQTIKLAVNYGMEFEKGMFGIIKSLMYLDGMAIRCKPDAILIEDMRESIKKFKIYID